jgi:hypothetical protein
MRIPGTFFGIVALTLASTSCLRQKSLARVFIPPPSRPPVTVPDAPATLTDPPEISADIGTLAPPPLPDMAPDALEVPEAPKRVARRPTPTVTPTRPSAAGPATPDAPPPRLAQLYTPEEAKQLTRILEESLESVNRAVAIVEGKNLTPAQKDIAERIRTFRKQAEQARRDEDLLAAVSLASRADLLAKDLLERLP